MADDFEMGNEDNMNEMINHLINNKETFFKSQQRDEKELEDDEKRKIASDIFKNSKSIFLSRFGKNLKEEHLDYFNNFTNNEKDGYDLKFYIQNLKRHFSKSKRKKDIRNRRFSALNKLIQNDSYFSEVEMMKRNPLLYDQLVGQYLSEEERKKRDNAQSDYTSFVNVLLEGIDRDAAREKKRAEEQYEDDVMEEEEDDSDQEKEPPDEDRNTWKDYYEKPSTSKWGEFSGSEKYQPIAMKPTNEPISLKQKDVFITATERHLLKEEFLTTMYENFIDGKDTDFDYSAIDCKEDYDNLDIKNCDAEDKYFDSESPETVEENGGDEEMKNDDIKMEKNDSSEDELDVFMERLNQHHSIRELSEGMSNL